MVFAVVANSTLGLSSFPERRLRQRLPRGTLTGVLLVEPVGEFSDDKGHIIDLSNLHLFSELDPFEAVVTRVQLYHRP